MCVCTVWTDVKLRSWLIILYYIILYYIIFYYIIFNIFIILYYITLYYILLYYIIFYYTTFYYIILYYTILYYIILHFIILYLKAGDHRGPGGIVTGSEVLVGEVVVWRCPCQCPWDMEVWEAKPWPEDLKGLVPEDVVLVSRDGHGNARMAGGDYDSDPNMFSFDKDFIDVVKATEDRIRQLPVEDLDQQVKDRMMELEWEKAMDEEVEFELRGYSRRRSWKPSLQATTSFRHTCSFAYDCRRHDCGAGPACSSLCVEATQRCSMELILQGRPHCTQGHARPQALQSRKPCKGHGRVGDQRRHLPGTRANVPTVLWWCTWAHLSRSWWPP